MFILFFGPEVVTSYVLGRREYLLHNLFSKRLQIVYLKISINHEFLQAVVQPPLKNHISRDSCRSDHIYKLFLENHESIPKRQQMFFNLGKPPLISLMVTTTSQHYCALIYDFEDDIFHCVHFATYYNDFFEVINKLK